ncbi:MAG TPA: NFACT RNA binding domain-containing protein [Myxococcota bacterium]|nr:NFACT RNA binding domain-containing protein [Myxococcota bacterium]
MSLTLIELADVVSELSACLPGSLLSKLSAPTPRSCQIALRGGGATRTLYIDLAPGLTRLHLIDSRKRSPATPPAWVMKARSELAGRRLVKIGLIGDDRIVRLDFAQSTGAGQHTLVAELFGLRGRLLLLTERGAIMHALVGDADTGGEYRPPSAHGGGVPGPSRFPAADPATLAANRAVDAHYTRLGAEQALAERRRSVTHTLERQLRKLSGLVEKLRADLSRTAQAEDLSRQAEALKAGLHRVRKGMSRIELTDYCDPQTGLIAIELSAALTPVENMERLFARSQRLERGRAQIEPRLRETLARRDQLTDLLARLQQAKDVEEIEVIEASFVKPAGLKKRVASRRQPYKTYLSKTGRKIMVGRSAKDNNQLTFHVARASDLWLHARNRPGAHVVVSLGKNEEIDEQTLLDAATLSASLAGCEEMEVAYTRVKNLRPVKGQPGLVSLTKERTIDIRVEPARIERLRKSQQD